MRFLKILFWLAVGIAVALFSAKNWRDVTIELWGNLQVDVKIPVLLAIVFLAGLLPAMIVYRTRLWRLQNRVTIPQNQPPAPAEPESRPPE